MAVSLGGVDGLVFTAGIGEHAAPIRQAIVDRLASLWTVKLDASANEAASETAEPTAISTPDSAIAVHVVPTDEEAMIARHTWRLWQRHRSGS